MARWLATLFLLGAGLTLFLLGCPAWAREATGSELQEAERLVREYPSDASAHLHLGQLYRLDSRYEEAIQEANEVIRLVPPNRYRSGCLYLGDAHFLLGNIYEILERYDEAIAEYKLANQFFYPCQDVLGDLFMKLLRYEEAIVEYENDYHNCVRLHMTYEFKASGLSPNPKTWDDSIPITVDMIDYSIGKLAKAVLRLIRAYTTAGRLTDANDTLQLFINSEQEAVSSQSSLSWEFADVYSELGYAFADLGRAEEAIAALNEAIRIAPDYSAPCFSLGMIYIALGRDKEAIRTCEECIRRNPDSPRAYYNLSLMYMTLGRDQEAIGACKEGIRQNPEYPMTYNYLGNVYAGIERYEEAIDAYQDAIRLDPELAVAYSNLGRSYIDLGRIEEGIAACEEAIRLDPQTTSAYFSLGVAYGNLGRREDAVKALEQYLELTPGDPEGYHERANELLSQLKGLD